jgi:hypothetical protein
MRQGSRNPAGRWLALGLLALAMIAARPARADDAVVLGVLESLSPAQQRRLTQAYGEASAPALARVLFRKRGGQWESFPAEIPDMNALAAAARPFPAEVEWTVAFDGRPLGRLRSRRPAAWLAYEDVGVQVISAGTSPPQVGSPDPAYETWNADVPARRPLVLVSAGQVGDPDRWKPAKPDDALLDRGVGAFLKQIEIENQDLHLTPADAGLMKAYRSRRGEALLAFAIRNRQPPPDEVPGEEWSMHWFLARDDGALAFLGNGLLLIDAGDYDGDGRSELVFRESSYDMDGYVLFSDDFRGKAEFGWAYH